MNLNSFVIDRPLRGMMLHSATGEVMWTINQIEEPSLSVSADTADAVDALGAPIMSFDRAKSAEFSAQSSLFDLGLLAAQSGTEMQVSSASNKIVTPCFEEIEKNGESVTLKHMPKGEAKDGIPYIYVLNGNGTLGKKYEYGATANETAFTFSGKTLTFPTDAALTDGTTLLVIYEYEADNTEKNQAVAVTNSAQNFPRAGKFVMEVLGCDTCDTSTLYYAYIIFPNAKLTSDFDLSFTTDGKHPFTLKAMQDYCAKDKKLFTIVIPEAE